MPKYDFQCVKTPRHVEELRVSFDYDPLDMLCSQCGSPVVRVHQVYPVGIQFKGGGWGGKPVVAPTYNPTAAERMNMNEDQAREQMHRAKAGA